MDSKGLECAVSGRSKSTPTANEYSPSTGQLCGDGTTCARSRQSQLTSGELTLSVVGSHAKTSAAQACGQGYTENVVDCSLKPSESLAFFDLDSQSWRTSQRCWIQGLASFLERWPRSGLMRSGIAYRLPGSVRITSGTAFLFWPTPTATDGRRSVLRVASLAKSHEKQRLNGAGTNRNLNEVLAAEFGLCLHPKFSEWLMGFPEGWTKID